MPIPDERGNFRGYSGVDKDITESKMTKQSLEEQLKFEALLTDILGRLTNLTSDEVDREIEDAQRRVCEYLGLDLSTLWQRTAESPPTFTMTHVYRSLEGPLIPETMDARQSFPWCMDEIMAGRIISVADVEKTPPEAEHDREEWRHLGIKSALTFPLSLGGRPAIGALNFCSIREQYEWPDTLVKHLQLIAQVFSNVIARKRWEEAIMRSEAKYRGLHEGMMDGFVMANHDGMIMEYNDTYLKMTGYNPEELLRLTYRDLTPERWHDFEQEIVEQQVLVRGYSEIYEKEYRKKDGTVFPVELRTFLSKAETGNKAGMWAIIRDISDRKRVQVALYESKERFRHVAENIADFIWEIDTNGLYQYVSPSIEGILGYQPDELIGKVCFYDLFAEEVREELKGAAFEVFAAKERFRAFPNSNISKDGRVVHLETSGAPVLDKAGNLVGYRGADTDVTYRKQMEEKIQTAAQDWQTVFDSIPDVVMMLDRDYRVIRANAATNSFLGLSMEDIVGHYCYTLMHGMEKPDEDGLFAEMRRSKRHAEKELYDETRHAWFRISVDPGFRRRRRD